MSMLRVAFLLGLLSSISACDWVKPNESAAKVKVAEAGQVGACRRVATTKVSVLDNVAGMPRSYRTMFEELSTLARNQATELGCDTVASESDIVAGEMSFGVFSCQGQQEDGSPQPDGDVTITPYHP